MENQIDTLTEGTRESISNNICEPIKNLVQLKNCIEKPPKWVNSIIPLTPRSNFVVKNSDSDCHYDPKSFHAKFRFDSRVVPRTLVCHDMKNGYLEDKYVGSMRSGNGYTFYHWAQIDTFVYFSHHFITIPPLSWINVAHNNGVKILGTLITEWEEGEKICAEIFQDTDTMKRFVEDLVAITSLYKIDGWLLNIENSVENASVLKAFVEYLTKKLHRDIPGTLVIWYDSVTDEGKLSWQNELNENNRCYFDVCDGIFLNYTWKESNLLTSLANANHRNLDVYVGIDVFGRNTFGGGKFNAYVAAEVIRKHNLSIALFAQGWTHETLSKQPEDTFAERFFNRNNAFWASLWQHLYTHPINKLFETYFYTGVDKNWYNLHNQDIQLTKILHPKLLDSEYSDMDIFSKCCKCLQVNVDDNNTTCLLNKKTQPIIHHLFCCDIEVHGRIYVYTITKKDSDSSNLNLIILSQNLSGSFNKHLCKDKQQDGVLVLENDYIEVANCDDKIVKNVPHPFKDEEINLRVYSLNFEHSRILEIGAEVTSKAVSLCGFGMLKTFH